MSAFQTGWLWLTVVFLLFFGFYDVYSFNLEPRLPVIKRGASGSYFGYSVAEHQSILEDETVKDNWLLVGAPLGQNLQPGTRKSGALWRCPVTTRLDDCTQVITDGKKNPEDDEYDKSIDSGNLMRPSLHEIKEDQWMGVTVHSQGPGKKVMVCAHRYIHNGTDFRWGQGLCYTLTQWLDYDDSWSPCKGRPTFKAHEQYGFCQAGTSGQLLEDDTMLVGAPGPYTWRGTMYVMDVKDNFLERNSQVYYAPVEDGSKTRPVDKYSYLGMSVAGGKFFSERMSYMAGAPRSNGTGQVIFFSRSEVRQQNELKVELILDGEQFGSSFGYVILAADVNGDGRTEAIVSAPFYFNKADGGAVYVFTNEEDYCLDCSEPLRLTGQGESRFGFALANLGDLNKDGFDDIAVGAPYEDRGVIYIYLGSAKGLIKVPAQTVRASELPYNLATFGYSLSGGMDLDGNSYPDLLVGAFDSDAVVLLRSRPIIGITTKITEKGLRNIDPSKPGCPRDPNSNYTCFSFDACCTIESWSGNGNLQLIYELEAEVFERKFSRVWFAPRMGSDPKPYRMNHTIWLNKSEHCQIETVYLKDKTIDIQSAIKFRLSYTLVQRQPRAPTPGAPLPSVNDFPILNQQEAFRSFQASFLTDCGDDDICESDVRLHTHLSLPHEKPRAYQLSLGAHSEVALQVTAINQGESAYEAQLFIVHPASLNYVSHKAQTKHVICTPFNKTLVICGLGNPFKRTEPANLTLKFDPKAIGDSETHMEFRVFANSTSQEVSPKAPSRLHVVVVRRAEVSLRGAATPDHVLYGGAVKGESAMTHLGQLGPRVEHAMVIYNEGPWKVSSLELHVEWPHQVANDKPQGKWLLYLDEPPRIDSVGGGECRLAPGLVNPLGLLSRPEPDDLDPSEPPTPAVHANRTLRRRRRDTEMFVKAEEFVNKEGRKEEVVRMDCQLGSAKCVKWVCEIRELPAKQEAVVRISARLWNSTLVAHYDRVGSVRIVSRARIHMPKNVRQAEEDDRCYVETVAYPDLLDQAESEPVPLWIIIVAIVAGLLLLIVLTLILWKCGFFKRIRPDPTLSGNLEKTRLRDDTD